MATEQQTLTLTSRALALDSVLLPALLLLSARPAFSALQGAEGTKEF